MASVSDAGKEPLRDIRFIRGFRNFSRNPKPNLAQYISERPNNLKKKTEAKAQL
jgi:hypothetical protein